MEEEPAHPSTILTFDASITARAAPYPHNRQMLTTAPAQVSKHSICEILYEAKIQSCSVALKDLCCCPCPPVGLSAFSLDGSTGSSTTFHQGPFSALPNIIAFEKAKQEPSIRASRLRARIASLTARTTTSRIPGLLLCCVGDTPFSRYVCSLVRT
jgi:hypothetical protein